MTEVDSQYAALLQAVMHHGTTLKTRNSVVKRLTGWEMEFTKTPLVGLRKTAWRNALREWEWFSSGSSKIDDLHESVRHWWQPWANENGEVRNNYSEQFRTACGGVVNPKTDEIDLVIMDQLERFVEGIRDHPYSRRNVLTTWNAAEMLHPSTPITNCHNTITQAFVEEGATVAGDVPAVSGLGLRSAAQPDPDGRFPPLARGPHRQPHRSLEVDRRRLPRVRAALRSGREDGGAPEPVPADADVDTLLGGTQRRVPRQGLRVGRRLRAGADGQGRDGGLSRIRSDSHSSLGQSPGLLSFTGSGE